MTASSRWEDNPFRNPDLTPEQVEYADRRGAAFREYYRTGNPEPLREFGFNLPDKSTQGQMSQKVRQVRQAVPKDDAR